MSLQQKAIREAFASRLQAALGATAKVFRATRRELGQGELPAVIVYSVSDRPEDDEQSQRYAHSRAYTLRAEIRVEGRPEDDVTEGICDTIRAAVFQDDTLGGLCHRAAWTEQAWDGDEGEWPLAGTILDFTFHYLHEATP